jgi:hypothetical protein
MCSILSSAIQAFKNNSQYLVSSNKLLEVDGIDIYYTYLPTVSISAFSCELCYVSFLLVNCLEKLWQKILYNVHE